MGRVFGLAMVDIAQGLGREYAADVLWEGAGQAGDWCVYRMVTRAKRQGAAEHGAEGSMGCVFGEGYAYSAEKPLGRE